MRKEIVFIGRGEEIAPLGQILAKAAQLVEGNEATHTDYYGVAAAEGVASEVIISDEPINFPGVVIPDILVAMSQEGYNARIRELFLDGEVFFDLDLVKTILPAKAIHFPVPATKIANEFGSEFSASMVILGAMVAITELVSISNLFEAVKEESGKSAEADLDALREGYKFGKRYLIRYKK